MSDHFDSCLNPLFIRELRRFVRNRFIIILINLFIAVLVLAAIIGLLQETVTSGNFRFSSGYGQNLFFVFMMIFILACFPTVILYSASAAAAERINEDLMYISTISPFSIVAGRLLNGALMTLLLMSITFPFITLAYMLRGLDIEFVAIWLIQVFVVIQVINAAMVAVFSSFRQKANIAGAWVAGGIIMFFGFFWIINLMAMLFWHGPVGASSSWNTVLLSLIGGGSLFAIFFVAGMSVIAPDTSNRATPLRVLFTVLFVFYALVTGLSIHIGMSAPMDIEVFSALVCTFLIVLLLSITTERDTWSLRIKKMVPRRYLLRTVLFPFFTGAPCGIAWFFGVVGVLFLMNCIAFTGSVELHAFYFLLYAFDFCATALLIRALFRFKSKMAGPIIALLLLLFCTLGSLLLFYLFYGFDSIGRADYSTSDFAALNLFMVFDYRVTTMNFNGSNFDVPVQFYSAAIWAMILLPCLLVWFAIRVRQFSPRALADAITLEQAIEIIHEEERKPFQR